MVHNAYGPLLRTVLESIFEVFIMCFMGWVLARRGVLDKTTQRKLNIINVSLFTPCLLFSKVAFSLSPQKLKELWIIPIFFVIVTVISAIVAWVMATFLHLKRSQRNFCMAAAMFNNSNSLPIALMQSMVVTVKGLKWGDDDTKDAMLGRALGYLVLYSTLGMMLRWSYGVHLLSQADEEVSLPATDEAPVLDVQAGGGSLEATEPPGFGIRQSDRSFSDVFHRSHSQATLAENTILPARDVPSLPRNQSIPRRFFIGPRKGTNLSYHSFPNTPVRSLSPAATPTRNDDASVQEREDDEWGNESTYLSFSTITPPSSSRLQSRARRTKNALLKTVKAVHRFMTVPLYAALASFVVALIPPLQHVMMEHVAPVKGFLVSAGACSIPITMVVLGAYFYQLPPPLKATEPPPSPAVTRVSRTMDASESEDERSSILVREDRDIEQGRESPRSLRARLDASQLSITTLAGSVKSALKMDTLRRGFQSTKEISSESEIRSGETTTVIVSCLARMVVTPMVVLPAMGALALYEVYPLFEDPVFVVSSVLLISAPPALTLAQITQAAAGDAFERLVSRTIFWAYCVLTPPLTLLYVVIGLHFSRL
ncbi:membrane transport protein-domain-containing protein [Cantharellus anzutake]|uniref:membrane transport protein-domain-containing protein n=1 Tax=Cantharellus anzutake TaxID=1750568 RepID=UPI001905A428|nr:membrane transport protein-domain-containing protein [Cantharellus anzutake]KAF8342735.1 membrane transport protein-domain-containing protein [Cantharellus anzutake]